MDALRVEPFVVDGLQFASLFQAGEFVVDDVNNLLVVANDAQLAGRNVNAVEHKAIEMILLHLALEGFLAPDEIAALLVANGQKPLLRRAIADAKG